jgi:acetyltransferase-like isoleucine patch superfamily enzyme
MLWLYLLGRSFYLHAVRILFCEPLFKAYCKEYGKRLRTGAFIHWVQGHGDIIVGDDVRIDGKCVITFGRRFVDRPVLRIGDNTGIGHNCRFIVGRQVTIGSNCALSGDIEIFDSNGHPTQLRDRLARQAPEPDEVRPVTIGDGVWIGRHCLIFPGVRIGAGSVVSAGSVVRMHVPPYSVVAGNPAKVMFRLPQAGAEGAASSVGAATSKG